MKGKGQSTGMNSIQPASKVVVCLQDGDPDDGCVAAASSSRLDTLGYHVNVRATSEVTATDGRCGL